MDPRIFHLKLASAAYLSRTPFPAKELFQAFHTPEGILSASSSDLEAVSGLHPIARRALTAAGDQERLLGELAVIENHGIRMISFNDTEYPEGLRQIPDPPPVLFVKGHILREDNLH